jgi:hypothetical protein
MATNIQHYIAELDRPCRVCGFDEWVRRSRKNGRATRFDALVCGKRCQKLKDRGHDLAYLRDLPSALAQAKRFKHDLIDSLIETERALLATEKEGRKANRNRGRPVHLKANPDPAPVEGSRYASADRKIFL